MSISGIGYQNLSSGLKIYSAADDPSGKAIAEKLKTQSTGYDVGTENAQSGKDALKVADGALGSIGDSLQRIKELALKASNSAIMSDDEKGLIQKEIDQLKQGIQETAKNTSFNSVKLLDGSSADLKLATNPDGTGQSIKMVNSTLENLGIADFNVNGEFDVSKIDDAIEMVSEKRSSIGAQSNGLDSKIAYNQYSSYNTTASRSRIEDLDYGKASVEKEKEKLLEQYRIQMQKRQMEEDPKRNLINTLM